MRLCRREFDQRLDARLGSDRGPLLDQPGHDHEERDRGALLILAGGRRPDDGERDQGIHPGFAAEQVLDRRHNERRSEQEHGQCRRHGGIKVFRPEHLGYERAHKQRRAHERGRDLKSQRPTRRCVGGSPRRVVGNFPRGIDINWQRRCSHGIDDTSTCLGSCYETMKKPRPPEGGRGINRLTGPDEDQPSFTLPAADWRLRSRLTQMKSEISW